MAHDTQPFALLLDIDERGNAQLIDAETGKHIDAREMLREGFEIGGLGRGQMPYVQVRLRLRGVQASHGGRIDESGVIPGHIVIEAIQREQPPEPSND